jgi:DNA-binding NtrC family response regulator
MITAFGDWDTYAKALEKSVSKFINKPVKKEEIVQIIKDILG